MSSFVSAHIYREHFSFENLFKLKLDFLILFNIRINNLLDVSFPQIKFSYLVL